MKQINEIRMQKRVEACSQELAQVIHCLSRLLTLHQAIWKDEAGQCYEDDIQTHLHNLKQCKQAADTLLCEMKQEEGRRSYYGQNEGRENGWNECTENKTGEETGIE